MPAPQAPLAIDVCPDVHILPLVFGKLVAGGVVTVEQFMFLRSAQSLYSNHDPWIPTELPPEATDPIASGMIGTPGQAVVDPPAPDAPPVLVPAPPAPVPAPPAPVTAPPAPV